MKSSAEIKGAKMSRVKINSVMRHYGLALSCAAVLALPVASARAATVTLVPHRAVYDLALDHVQGASGVESAHGRIVFELEGAACTGITQTFRQLIVLSGGEIGAKLIDTQSVTTEEADGKTMRFSVLNRVGTEPVSQTLGVATRKEESVSVRLSSPVQSEAHYPSTTLYPGEHYRTLIEAALKGERFVARQIFDGADEGQSAPQTFTVIGAPVQNASSESALLERAGMAKLKRWPVEIAYFDQEKATVEEPSYRASMDLLENGVSTNLRLDYTNFSLRGVLVSLDVSPTPPCP